MIDATGAGADTAFETFFKEAPPPNLDALTEVLAFRWICDFGLPAETPESAPRGDKIPAMLPLRSAALAASAAFAADIERPFPCAAVFAAAAVLPAASLMALGRFLVLPLPAPDDPPFLPSLLSLSCSYANALRQEICRLRADLRSAVTVVLESGDNLDDFALPRGLPLGAPSEAERALLGDLALALLAFSVVATYMR